MLLVMELIRVQNKSDLLCVSSSPPEGHKTRALTQIPAPVWERARREIFLLIQKGQKSHLRASMYCVSGYLWRKSYVNSCRLMVGAGIVIESKAALIDQIFGNLYPFFGWGRVKLKRFRAEFCGSNR